MTERQKKAVWWGGFQKAALHAVSMALPWVRLPYPQAFAGTNPGILETSTRKNSQSVLE